MKNDGDHWRAQWRWGWAGPLLLGLTVLGLALRVAGIGRAPLWSDEALTAIITHYPWWSLPFTAIDPTPPLFYWLEQALVPRGAAPAAWRMVSLVVGVATIPIVYWLVRELKSSHAGLIAGGLVAVSAPLIDYSQEARAYALCVALIAGSAAALATLVDGRLGGFEKQSARRRMLAIFGLLTLLAAWTHFIAVFWVFPALFILRLAAHGERRAILPRELIAAVAVIVPFLAIELRRLYLYRSEQSFAWLTQASPAEILRILGEQWIPFARAGGGWAALVGLGLLLAMVWVTRRSLVEWGRTRRLQAAIVGLLLVQPAGLWLLGELVAPVAMPRTLLPATLGFAALVGIAMASLRNTVRVAAGVGLIGVSLASILANGTTRPKEQWAGAAAATRGAPLVVTCANWKTPAYLASASGSGWVVTSYGGRALVVRQPGEAAAWDRLYFDRVQRWAHYPLRRDRPLTLEPRSIAADRLVFVASECSAVERTAFAKWANVRGSRLLWSVPRTGDAAEIRVEEWQLTGSVPLRAWIVR